MNLKSYLTFSYLWLYISGLYLTTNAASDFLLKKMKLHLMAEQKFSFSFNVTEDSLFNTLFNSKSIFYDHYQSEDVNIIISKRESDFFLKKIIHLKRTKQYICHSFTP